MLWEMNDLLSVLAELRELVVLFKVLCEQRELFNVLGDDPNAVLRELRLEELEEG